MHFFKTDLTFIPNRKEILTRPAPAGFAMNKLTCPRPRKNTNTPPAGRPREKNTNTPPAGRHREKYILGPWAGWLPHPGRVKILFAGPARWGRVKIFIWAKSLNIKIFGTDPGGLLLGEGECVSRGAWSFPPPKSGAWSFPPLNRKILVGNLVVPPGGTADTPMVAADQLVQAGKPA